MKRRTFMGGLVAGLAIAGPALAEGVVDGIVRQLKNQGFRSVVQERTLLGRVRITANRKDGSREIIVNPRTGEILRDLWTPIDGKVGSAPIIKEPSDNSGKGGGNGGGGRDDDDDDGDDDDDDDDKGGGSGSNSGSGGSSGSGGNSGSGGSGSDGGDDKDED